MHKRHFRAAPRSAAVREGDARTMRRAFAACMAFLVLVVVVSIRFGCRDSTPAAPAPPIADAATADPPRDAATHCPDAAPAPKKHAPTPRPKQKPTATRPEPRPTPKPTPVAP